MSVSSTSHAEQETSTHLSQHQPAAGSYDLPQFLLRSPEEHGNADLFLSQFRLRGGLQRLIGNSPSFTTIIRSVINIARTDASVLIVGETGTGKELSARAIHSLSERADHPFVPVNCGALPVDLVENELFGHARGAFTGADSHRDGVIHEAEGGTLFLDELDSLPLIAQVKLLRLLQEKEYRALGSAKLSQANVRIIAATNGNIEKLLADGRLRRDLYYRINTLQLRLPPLRARPEDIPLLVQHFVTKYAKEYKKTITHVSPEVLQLLLQYDWPGNVRELEHVVARAVAGATHSCIQSMDMPNPEQSTGMQECFRKAKMRVVAEFEKSYIQRLLLAHNGNITKAAQAAGKHRRAFWELMRKHRIPLPHFPTRVTALSVTEQFLQRDQSFYE